MLLYECSCHVAELAKGHQLKADEHFLFIYFGVNQYMKLSRIWKGMILNLAKKLYNVLLQLRRGIVEIHATGRKTDLKCSSCTAGLVQDS